MEQLRIGCVVMAAGNASRFGENKLAAVVDGKTLIERALDAVPADHLAAVCVVTQYDEIEKMAALRGFRCIRNDRPGDGISRTVRLGTEALMKECGAILYLVCDQPFLRRGSVASLIECFREDPGRIVSASHAGERGNPCIFPAKYFSELCALTGDVGGGSIIRAHKDALTLFELDERELLDADTKEAISSFSRTAYLPGED